MALIFFCGCCAGLYCTTVYCNNENCTCGRAKASQSCSPTVLYLPGASPHLLRRTDHFAKVNAYVLWRRTRPSNIYTNKAYLDVEPYQLSNIRGEYQQSVP